MAIITEEPDSPTPQLRHRKPKANPEREPEPEPKLEPPSQPSSTSKSISNAANPFQFWLYFILGVSIVTLFSVLLSSLSPQDPRTWFLNLPPNLRHHYSAGRTIKVQTAPNHPQIELFSIQQGDANSDSRLLIIHGLGCSSFAFRDVINFLGHKNALAVAIDLPGSGFSDKSVTVVEETEGGGGMVERLRQVYEDIKEKGLFWGFDQLVEQGYVDLEANRAPQRMVKKEVIKAIEFSGEEMGRLLGQVVDTFRLAPVDLVLHDSAFVLSAGWISENRGLVRSVVVLDGSPGGTALPVSVLGVPVVREVVLGLGVVFRKALELCCVRGVGRSEAEGHRVLLRGRDGGRAVAGMGKRLNLSFDLSEWGSLESLKGLPVQVIWSGGWSDGWTAEGQRVAGALSQGTFVSHSGGRWIRAQNAEEVAESIHKFISSLPKPTRQAEELPMPGNYRETFSDHHHHDHHHDHGGYMDGAYGMGHGWGM